MKFNKKSTVTSCLVLCLSAALMVGCKPIFEKKPLPPKDDAAAAAPAPAVAPDAAPAPAEPAEIEDVPEHQGVNRQHGHGRQHRPAHAQHRAAITAQHFTPRKLPNQIAMPQRQCKVFQKSRSKCKHVHGACVQSADFSANCFSLPASTFKSSPSRAKAPCDCST